MTKLEEWRAFSYEMEKHIVDYCVVQYGDYPDELIDLWSVDSIKDKLGGYVKRIGLGARGSKEGERDALKIAHYACYLLKFLRRDSE